MYKTTRRIPLLPWGALRLGQLFCALSFVALLASGCSDDATTVAALCRDDADCSGGLLCENSACVDPSTKACEVITEGNPVLQPSPHAVAFGELEREEHTLTFTVQSLGNCSLTIFEANIRGGDAGAFSCEACGGRFPIEIFPRRKRDFEIKFKAPGVGDFRSELVLLSDDKEFPEIRVPLQARFIGIPNLRVAPNPVDFGFVAVGRSQRKSLQLTNQGSGFANIVVQSVALEPADTADFSLPGNPIAEPVALRPINGDFNDILTFEVQYHPRTTANHSAALLVRTDKGETRIPLQGGSETPPRLTLSTDNDAGASRPLLLGQIPLGQSRREPLNIKNAGGTPLVVSFSISPVAPATTTDLFVNPTVLPPIPPGQHVTLEVGAIPSKLGDLAGVLNLTSNDPSRPTAAVSVSGEGIPGNGTSVVKIELTYENGKEGTFDSDLRNVDMTLESPPGFVCNKDIREPRNWGDYGNPVWLSFAPKEEPERIILADATRDGTYLLSLAYIEDCSTLPTGAAAGLLGVTLDTLVGALSSGVIQLEGQDISEIIAKTCTNRSATTGTVTVYVDGNVLAERPVQLSRRGDRNPRVLELVRSGGKFTVR